MKEENLHLADISHLKLTMPVDIVPPSRSTRLLVNCGNHHQLGICTAGDVDSLKTKYKNNTIVKLIPTNARLLVSRVYAQLEELLSLSFESMKHTF